VGPGPPSSSRGEYLASDRTQAKGGTRGMEIGLPGVTERRNWGADAPPEPTPILTAIS
jgi:hypothetical protein